MDDELKKSKLSQVANKIDKITESPLLNSIIKLIKKLKSSKSYWSVSLVVILFILREVIAWKYSNAIKAYAEKQLEENNLTWLWSIIDFIFDFGGSIELAIGGFIIFLILSLVKISEGAKNTITLKESFLSILLLFVIGGMSVYILLDNSNHNKNIYKEQQNTNIKLDEIKALIKLQGGDETEFLKKYFGQDYVVVLKNPKTYHNFTALLKKTNTSADELLEEREKLLKKIASQNFNSKFQKKINKAFKELRYSDVRKLIDTFLKDNKSIEENLIKAYYLKALSYYEQQQYLDAKKEFENIASNVSNPNILFERAYTYYMLGNYDKAIEYYNKLLKLAVAPLQDYYPSILTIYDHVGLAYYSSGYYNKALKYYEKSLKLRLLSAGKNDSNLLTNYMNIGLTLHKKGENEKAHLYYIKCLDFIEENFVPIKKNEKQDSVIIDKEIFNNTINFFFEFNKIKIYYHRELNYIKTLFKLIDNPLNITKDKNIINTLECSNKQMFNLNNTLPSTAIIYESIATDCSILYEYNKSITYYNKALKIQLSNFGEYHPNTARIYENIGSLYKNTKEYEKALNYYQKSLKIRLLILQKNHMDIAISYHFIGSMLYRTKEYTKSIDYYQKALNILRKVFPKGHGFIEITESCIKNEKNKPD